MFSKDAPITKLKASTGTTADKSPFEIEALMNPENRQGEGEKGRPGPIDTIPGTGAGLRDEGELTGSRHTDHLARSCRRRRKAPPFRIKGSRQRFCSRTDIESREQDARGQEAGAIQNFLLPVRPCRRQERIANKELFDRWKNRIDSELPNLCRPFARDESLLCLGATTNEEHQHCSRTCDAHSCTNRCALHCGPLSLSLFSFLTGSFLFRFSH